MMLEAARWSVSELPLLVLTAIGTHLVVSGSQTLFHCGLGHHPLGGVSFRNHIRFHHAYYARGHLWPARIAASRETTPHTFLTVLAAAVMFFVLPFDFFLVTAAASAGPFCAHIYFDRAYHAEDSKLARFAWFRHKRQLHFVDHLHANSNFAVIDFFWDRLLGTYPIATLKPQPQHESPPLCMLSKRTDPNGTNIALDGRPASAGHDWYQT
jgi:hypothetical protein